MPKSCNIPAVTRQVHLCNSTHTHCTPLQLQPRGSRTLLRYKRQGQIIFDHQVQPFWCPTFDRCDEPVQAPLYHHSNRREGWDQPERGITLKGGGEGTGKQSIAADPGHWAGCNHLIFNYPVWSCSLQNSYANWQHELYTGIASVLAPLPLDGQRAAAIHQPANVTLGKKGNKFARPVETRRKSTSEKEGINFARPVETRTASTSEHLGNPELVLYFDKRICFTKRHFLAFKETSNPITTGRLKDGSCLKQDLLMSSKHHKELPHRHTF